MLCCDFDFKGLFSLSVNVYYQFGPWTFYPARCLLVSENIEKELDPLSYKLLNYILEQEQRIILRQELVTQVWQQNFVDNNAINRAISKLRKQLNHAEHQSQLIKTHHRIGYSLTVEVSKHTAEPKLEVKQLLQQKPLLTDELTQAPKEITPDGMPLTSGKELKAEAQQKTSINWLNNKYQLLISTLVFVTVLTLGWIFWVSGTAKTNSDLQHAPLVSTTQATWNSGSEYRPLISADRQYFAYNNFSKDIDSSFVKRIEDQHQEQLTYKEMEIKVLSWHANSNVILTALYKDNMGQCQFALFDLNRFPSISEPKILNKCGKAFNNSAELALNGNKLYFIKADEGYLGHAIYQYDLQSHQKTLVIPPTRLAHGVMHFELSSDGQYLAYLWSDMKGPMKAFLLNLTTQEHKLLYQFKHQWHSTALDWSLDNKSVVFADHNKLHKVNIANLQVETNILPEGTNPYNLEIEKKNQILFTPYILRHAELIKAKNLFNNEATVTERLHKSDNYNYAPASDSKQNGKLFFASNRTGSHQIWQSYQGELKQLTYLSNSTSALGQPEASHNGEYVLFNHNGKLKILNLKTKELLELSELPSGINTYLWSANDNAIIYLQESNDTSQIWKFDLLTRDNKQLLAGAIKALLSDQKGKIYYIKDEFLIALNKDKQQKLTITEENRKYSAITEKYFYSHDALSNLYRMDITTGQVKQANLLFTPGKFTVMSDDNTLIFTKYDFPDTHIKRLFWQ